MDIRQRGFVYSFCNFSNYPLAKCRSKNVENGQRGFVLFFEFFFVVHWQIVAARNVDTGQPGFPVCSMHI